ncbi:MAG: hypothetical protein KBD10_00950 [Candidatus Pacebacteria bacterium]|mgnify:CR=1 FL=1|nr:hypothetical protein [Candidatus Paceibacterota bacterium]
MEQINLYLKKYENFGFKERELKLKIIEVVKEETGLELDKELISIKDMTVNISVSGAAKAELFMKRNIIESKINDIKFIR